MTVSPVYETETSHSHRYLWYVYTLTPTQVPEVLFRTDLNQVTGVNLMGTKYEN